MSEIWEKESDVPYSEIARRLFPTDLDQQMVPFVGAGVSVSERPPRNKPVSPAYPSADTLDEVCRMVGIQDLGGEPRRFLEYAVRTALWMDEHRKSEASGAAPRPLLASIAAEPSPPFVWELAEVLAEEAAYTSFQDRPMHVLEQRDLLSKARRDSAPKMIQMFKLLADATGLTNSSDPLASIAGFLEYKTERGALYDVLARIFAQKKQPTATHRLVARAAGWHLARQLAEDYIIITTNYDSLMEKALANEGVRHVVLTVDKHRLAHARFAGFDAEELRVLRSRHKPSPSRDFRFIKQKSLAVLFKIHGCLNPEVEAPDGLVITEADYVEFISNLDVAIPAAIGSLLPTKRLLFLGYSFNDWNVRAVYENIRKRTGNPGSDYAITLALSTFERMYFRKRDICVALQPLSDFTGRIAQYEPPLGPSGAQ